MKTNERGTIYNISPVTFILVKRLGIAIFLRSQFFELKFTKRFQIFGHAVIYFWLKNLFNVFGFLTTIFVLFFLKLKQHMGWYIPNIDNIFIR